MGMTFSLLTTTYYDYLLLTNYSSYLLPTCARYLERISRAPGWMGLTWVGLG